MINQIKIYVFSVLGMILITPAMGQDTLSISQTELIEKVSGGNLQIQMADQAFASARADFKQSNALFLPSISASHIVISTTNPLMAFGSKLNQAILTPEDFNPDLLNNPPRTENYATVIEVMQPIINIDGIHERKAAKAKMEAYQLQSQRTREHMTLEINKAYMQLQLAYSAVDVLKKAKATAQKSLDLINNYHKQGMLQKSDVIDMQIRFNEIDNQLQSAKQNIQNASDYIRFLINEPSESEILKPTVKLTSEISPLTSIPTISGERKDLLALDKQTEAYQKMYRSAKSSLMPRLNAFGNYQMYDDKLFGTNAKGYLIGASLSWTLFDGYKSIGKMEKNKIEYEKSLTQAQQYKSQSRLELNKALRQLKDAENKFNTAKLSSELAKESHRISKDRFEQGLVKTHELMMAETQILEKELLLLQATFEYKFNKQYIQFLIQ